MIILKLSKRGALVADTRRYSPDGAAFPASVILGEQVKARLGP